MKQKVQDPLHATMLGLKRVINNAPLVQQPPHPTYPPGTGLSTLHGPNQVPKNTTKASLVSILQIRNQSSHTY